MTATNKTAATGQGALVEAQAAKEIEAEVSASFRTMMDMLKDDARRGTVKVTDGRDPRKRDWADAKNAGRREPDTASVRERAARQEGAQADRAIQTASADLERLGKIDGMSPSERQLSQLV
jgi:hypothetical protein